MTDESVENAQREILDRAGGDGCAACAAATADIHLTISGPHAGSGIDLALPDACAHIVLGAPGIAPIELTTSVDALLLFLDGCRSVLELLFAGAWSLEAWGEPAAAQRTFDELASRLGPSGGPSRHHAAERASPAVYAQSCPAVTLPAVTASYRGLMLPEPWRGLPASRPARALERLAGATGPCSFALPLSPRLRSQVPLQSVVNEVGRVLGAAQRLACGAGSPERATAWHCDQADNLLAMLAGTKEIHLVPPGTQDPERLRRFAGTVDNVEWWLRTDDVPIDEGAVEVLTMQAGDVALIPAGWFHNVVNRTATLAVTNWFVTATAEIGLVQ